MKPQGEATDGRPIRVLAFTCSKNRPVLLRHCILQMRCQRHPVDHVVYINGDEDTRALYDDLASPRLFLRFGPSATNHLNHVNAIVAVEYQHYDLFCKIDDDDVYRLDYIESVVADFEEYRWDYSGAHSEGLINGRRWLPQDRWQSLGLTQLDRDMGVIEVMPPTTTFSLRAIECLLDLGESCPPADTAWRVDHPEDIGWRRAIARTELKQMVRAESRFTYNVHGHNISTAAWLRAEDESHDSGHRRTPVAAVGKSERDRSLVDRHYVAKCLTHEAPWCESHDANDTHLGMGLLYYSLVYTLRAHVAVCLGSGGGFVPRLMRQAQRDVGIATQSRTILVDANRPEAGWGAPSWLPEDSFFRRNFDDVEILLLTTREAAAHVFEPQGIHIDYLHVDADHSFESCFEDFMTYRRFLGPGSLVTLHDTRFAGAGVRSVIDHIRTLWDCEVIDFANIGEGTALVRIREGREPSWLAPVETGLAVTARRRAEAPDIAPLSIGWRYLDSEPFSMRQVIAAHFLKPCRTIIEIGASTSGIYAFLNGEHDDVIVVDPHLGEERWNASCGRPFRVSRVRGRFQDVQWYWPSGVNYGLVMLGMELQDMSANDYRELFTLIDNARITVIEFPGSWEPSRRQFDLIRTRTKTRTRFRAMLELVGNDFGDLSNSWPARTDRAIYVLEPCR